MEIAVNICSWLLQFHWIYRALVGAALGCVLLVFAPSLALLWLKPQNETTPKPEAPVAIGNQSATGNNNQNVAINSSTVFAGPVTINNPPTTSPETIIQIRLARELLFFLSYSLHHSVWLIGRDIESRIDHPPPGRLDLPIIQTVDDDKELQAIVEEVTTKFAWKIDPELKKIYTEIAIMSRHMKADIANWHQDAAHSEQSWKRSQPMAVARMDRWRNDVTKYMSALQQYCEYSGNEAYEDFQSRSTRTSLINSRDRP